MWVAALTCWAACPGCSTTLPSGEAYLDLGPFKHSTWVKRFP